MKRTLLSGILAAIFNLTPVFNAVINAQVAPIGSPAQAAQTNTIIGFTAAAGTSRVLIVTVSDALSTNIISASFGGSPMSEKAEHTDGTAVDAIYTLALGSSGSTTTGDIVVASANISNTAKFITARVFEKVDQGTPLSGIQAAHSGVSPVSSSMNISSATGALVFDIFDTWIDPAGGTRTPGGSQTLMHNVSAINLGAGNGFAYYGTSTRPGAAGTVNMSWSTSSHQAMIHIAASIQVSSVLPVTLLSFNAVLQQNDVVLGWKTAAAVNFNRFEVERSANGITFESAGSRPALTGTGNLLYDFTDRSAVTIYRSAAKVYYRLKMVDADGKFSYSKTVLVQLSEGRDGFSIYIPSNPFTDKINIGFTMKETGTVNIKLTDLAGRIIINKQLLVDKGFSTVTTAVPAELNSGLYLLQVRYGYELQTAKLVKQ